MVEKAPLQLESLGKMRSQSFHSESFRGVVAAVQDVNPEILRKRIGPMRALASNKSVYAFARGEFQMTASPAGDDADTAANGRPARKHSRRATEYRVEPLFELRPRHP